MPFFSGYLSVHFELKAGKQASRQAGKQAGRQAGKQEGKQASSRKAFSQSHALEGLVKIFLTYSQASPLQLISPSPKSKVPKSRPKGLGLKLKSHGPPTPPHNF